MHHGVPQTRRRFILLAAAPGYTLPSYPEPLHIFTMSLPRGSLILQTLESIGVPDELIYFYKEVNNLVECTIGDSDHSYLMGKGVGQWSPEGLVLFS